MAGAKCDAPFISPVGHPLAVDTLGDDEQRPRLRAKNAQIIALYSAPPEGATILYVEELGPVTLRKSQLPARSKLVGGWVTDQSTLAL